MAKGTASTSRSKTAYWVAVLALVLVVLMIVGIKYSDKVRDFFGLTLLAAE